jgi:hypothetical protein
MRLELTYQTPEWEPGSSSYADLEEKLLDDAAVGLSTGDLSSKHSTVRTLSVNNRIATLLYEHEASQSASVMASIRQVFCEDFLARSMLDRCGTSALDAADGSRSMSAETLAMNWSIPPNVQREHLPLRLNGVCETARVC